MEVNINKKERRKKPRPDKSLSESRNAKPPDKSSSAKRTAEISPREFESTMVESDTESVIEQIIEKSEEKVIKTIETNRTDSLKSNLDEFRAKMTEEIMEPIFVQHKEMKEVLTEMTSIQSTSSKEISRLDTAQSSNTSKLEALNQKVTILSNLMNSELRKK